MDIKIAISNQQSKILPVLSKVKAGYLKWFVFYQEIPKTHRYSLGQRIDILFVEVIEAISAASFLSREEKLPYVRLAIKKLDTEVDPFLHTPILLSEWYSSLAKIAN